MEPIQDDQETPYEPFDQDRLTYPWRHDAIKAWEDAHGHDIRLKCYVEFGCQVIEPTLERRIDALVAERDEAKNGEAMLGRELRATLNYLKDAKAERDRLIQALADKNAIAQEFHEQYESLAPEFGYETRKDSAVPWSDVPEPNKTLMLAVAQRVGEAIAREALTKTTEEEG